MGIRHKLQRIFLGNDGPLVAEYHRVDAFMQELERFDMTTEMLLNTKVGKVVKRIGQLKFNTGD